MLRAQTAEIAQILKRKKWTLPNEGRLMTPLKWKSPLLRDLYIQRIEADFQHIRLAP